MELYDEIRNALRRRGCPWIEDHVFEFMGQRLRFDIHDLGQKYILKIVHRATDRSAAENAEPYIHKNFSLEKTVDKHTLAKENLKKSCEALADGFLFWLEGMCFTPSTVRETVPTSKVIHGPRSRRP